MVGDGDRANQQDQRVGKGEQVPDDDPKRQAADEQRVDHQRRDALPIALGRLVNHAQERGDEDERPDGPPVRKNNIENCPKHDQRRRHVITVAHVLVIKLPQDRQQARFDLGSAGHGIGAWNHYSGIEG